MQNALPAPRTRKAFDAMVSAMASKLSVANPYLRDPAMRERTVFKSVASSSAIEGIRAPFQRTTDATRKPDTMTPAAPTRKSRITRARRGG